MSWILDLSILLSICRVYVYIYINVRLIMPSYLFFCIYFDAWYINCPKREEALEFTYRVIGEVLVLGLLVVYKIPYSSCMWTRQDVIGVFQSYYCLSGTTCVPVIVQYITTSLLLLSWLCYHRVYISLGWIVSAGTMCAASRRVLVERSVWDEILMV